MEAMAVKCPSCGTEVAARSKRRWWSIVAVIGALVLGIVAGVALGARWLQDDGIESDPWYAFVLDEEWRATPEAALAVAAEESYQGADYWYLQVNEDTDEVDYLLSADGATWDYRVAVLGWNGKWYAGSTDPIDLDLEPVPVPGTGQ